MAEVKAGEWFVAEGGTVAHRLYVKLPRARWPFWTWCSTPKEFARPATPEDRRCKRCEERSRG